ncbi:MAG: NADP-dependent oxidoreductase [Geodermatophilaceae bacterium]|nr:NADP-dependent oxidoreductase [Geodermatophilaceae bacterium]
MPTAFGFSRYGGTDVQEVLDVERPAPGAGELLVAVRAAGVNPVDWKIREGYLAEVMPLDLPAVLGREVAGVVEEVGQDVDGFSVHDEVLGTVAPGSGGYAEYTLVTASAATKKPPQVSFTDAAALPVAAGTAYDAIGQLALGEGESLLINGIGGGVGVAAAQLARDLAVFVLGTGSEEKRELAEAMGATLVPYGDGVADRVREIMPNGVDAILDLVGGDALRSVADLVSDRSRLLTTTDPDAAAEVGGGGVERDGSGAVLAEIVALVAEGKLDPHVSDVVPLDRAAEALASVESGHTRGKVVISVP